MSDEFTGIFDSLTPEDFAIGSTAIEEIPRTNKGVEQFNAFVDEQIRAFRVAWVANHGQLNPIAVLASPTMQRVFTPSTDETLGDYVKRLHREAVRMEAIWVFSARKTIVATMQADVDDAPDIGDAEALEEAIKQGTAAIGAEWFAERREGDENHRRFGIMKADDDDHLTDPREAPEGQASAWWSLILGA